jgi:glutathione synthase/RimK-type ligase-like ATP-grasp enzyme
MVTKQLETLGAEFAFFNQRKFDDCGISFDVSASGAMGELRLEGQRYPLSEIRGIYTRLMDDRDLPELQGEPEDSGRRRRCRRLHDVLTQWMEVAPGCVINRAGPMGSNMSKPYQAQLIRECGFAVPTTLVTSDPELVKEFRGLHKRVIYKSMSGVRSIVQELRDEDDERLELIRNCPTQFQAFVGGTNVRVHTVGDEVFATAIASEATDYRYATQQKGKAAELREVELSDDLAEKCVKLAKHLGLEFAGIDLKITDEDEVYCFEVNPCPAFSYYESHTGQGISAAVARRLMAA